MVQFWRTEVYEMLISEFQTVQHTSSVNDFLIGELFAFQLKFLGIFSHRLVIKVLLDVISAVYYN